MELENNWRLDLRRIEIGESRLHKAVGLRSLIAVTWCLKRKDNGDIQDVNGKTPLHKAVETGWIEGINMLVRYGVNINSQDARGETPLHRAIDCEIKLKDAIKTFLMIEDLNANLQDANGDTPLHRAIKVGAFDTARQLLQRGVNVNLQNRSGDTVLHVAIAARCDVSFIKELLEHKVDLGLRNADDRNAIELAINFENTKLLKLMLDIWPTIQQPYEKALLRLSILCADAKLLKFMIHNASEWISLAKVNDTLDFIKTFDDSRNELIDLIMCYGGNFGYQDFMHFISFYRYDRQTALLYPPTYYDKVSLLGYRVNYAAIVKVFQKYQPAWRNDEDLAMFQRELEELKTRSLCIHPKASLYDVLFFGPNRMAFYACANENLVNIFNDCKEDFATMFPHYGHILNYRMLKGLARSKLMNPATDALQLILANRLPEDCSQNIFKFFNEKDLRMFVECDWDKLIC